MTTANATASVEVRNLVKVYGSLRAVDHVSFSVAPGTVFGLLGPNGAGKTSILEMIEGLREPDEGAVVLFGEAGGIRDPRVRARLGIQLQSSALLPNLTVTELLALQASFFPDALSPTGLIDRVDLGSKARSRSGDLSGGQLQRLALALALIGDPDLVLLDEPTAGMDPAARRQLWSIVEELRADGKAVLLTTHYMEEAEALCDRVAILDEGRLVAMGSVDELAALRGGERVVFSSDSGFDPLALSRVAGVTEVGTRNGSTTLTTKDAGATLVGLVELGKARGRLPRALSVRRPTLEEIYLELTGRALNPLAA